MLEKGNVNLSDQEITNLSVSILDRYKTLTGQRLDPKILNSNVHNYGDLFTSVDNIASLKEHGIITAKPFVGIFHCSKNDTDKPKTFRKKFVNALYRYSFGCSRDEFFSSKPNNINSVAVKQLKNIEGYWQCYYSKYTRFFNKLETYRKADIGVVALTIRGENINKATVRFFQNENWGKGSVEVQGSNLIFHLRSEKNNRPTSLFMNCGGNYIHDRDRHIRYAEGECVYITDSGLPKRSPCLMEYFDNDRLEREFRTHDIDLASEKFQNHFSSTKEVSLDVRTDESIERIISLFQREQFQLT
jgi:hypothetical protein